MQFKNLLLTGTMIIGLVCNVWAGGKTSETLFTHAHILFERSLAGDDSVTAVALNKFKILSMIYRDNPLFLAYQGSCYTLMGRDAWMPWNKTGYTKKGLDIIEKALQMLKPKHDHETMRGAPISVETRLVAISTFAEVPKFFNYFERAKAVLDNLLRSSAFANSPRSLQAKVRSQAAKMARLKNKE